MNTMSKDFSDLKVGRVSESLAQATSTARQQTTASPEEQQERAEQLRTQGRKGCKATRINLALTPDNHKFIKTMANMTGQTMTEFTNAVIAKYRVEHPDLFDKAVALRNEVVRMSTIQE